MNANDSSSWLTYCSEYELSLTDLRKSIPSQCFEKDLTKSLYYMFFDYAMWFGSLFLFSSLVNSSVWTTLPFIVKAMACVVYWNFAGFFMWGIFVVGHDCGHGTFSNSTVLNDILGHVMHASILVPYYPWQVSFFVTSQHSFAARVLNSAFLVQ